MAARGVILSAICLVAGGCGLWAWSNYCEQYRLCYPACRVAENGVESWTRLAPIIRQSESIPAGASPGSECLSLLTALRKELPTRQVAIDTVNMADARKPAPFHRYSCTFDIREPVYALARNRQCPSSAK